MRKGILTLCLMLVSIPAMAARDPDDPGGGGGGNPPPGGGGGNTWQGEITFHAIDPQENTVEIRFDNNAVIVIDEQLGKVFLSSSEHSAELSLSQVLLQAAGGNSQTAAALRAEIHSLVARPEMMTMLVPSTSGVVMGMPGGHSLPCSFSWNCRQEFIEMGGGGGGSFGFWDIDSPSGYRGPDYDYWNHWRGEQCDAAQDDFVQAGIGVAELAGGCAFFTTGIGAALCAVGAITVVVSMDSAADNTRDCLSSYPGPGEW